MRHGKDPTHARKLELIDQHFDKLDQRQAVRNILEEQFNDWFIGQLGQSAQKFINKSGWRNPTGLESGGTLGGGRGWEAEGTPKPEGKSGQQQLAEFLSDKVVPASIHNSEALIRWYIGLRRTAHRSGMWSNFLRDDLY